MPHVEDVPLTDLKEGTFGVISRVKVRDEERLIYLAKIGAVPQAEFRLVGRAPFDGPIRLRLGKREEVIGAGLARQIRAEVGDRPTPA